MSIIGRLPRASAEKELRKSLLAQRAPRRGSDQSRDRQGAVAPHSARRRRSSPAARARRFPPPAAAKYRSRVWDKSRSRRTTRSARSEEHTSELQSLRHLVCRLLLEKKTN